MSSDIVDTLRKLAAIDNCQVSLAAADKIERLNEYIKRQAMDIILCKSANDTLHEENTRLRAALEPLACTCDRANGAACSRAEVNCAFWQARAELDYRKMEGGRT